MSHTEYEYLFGPGGETLLPTTRDAYLRGTLSAPEAAVVEELLQRDAVERGVALARSHQLAAQARRQRPVQAFEPPAWVQRQLLQQPSVSAWGPLRRPGLQLALGLLLLLGVASAVQWVRNKPLVPAPVVASFKHATRRLSRATQRLVSSAPLPAEDPADSTWLALAPAPKPARPEPAPRPPRAAGRTATPIEELEPTAVAVVSAGPDSAASESGPAAPALPAAAPRVVRGRVVDSRGEPLAGATVLVKGTGLGTSTDANGEYSLEAPAGAELQVGYAGCADQVLTAVATADVFDVTLERTPNSRRRAAPRL